MALFLVFVGAVGVWIDASAAEIVTVQGLCLIAHGLGCLANAWWQTARDAWGWNR